MIVGQFTETLIIEVYVADNRLHHRTLELEDMSEPLLVTTMA